MSGASIPPLTTAAGHRSRAKQLLPAGHDQSPDDPRLCPGRNASVRTALVLTYLHTDIGADPTPGQGNDVIYIIGNAACTARVGTFEAAINPATDGEQDTPLSPGLGIPSGDALCATQEAGVVAAGGVSGYTVPSSEVIAEPLHRLPNLHQR